MPHPFSEGNGGFGVDVMAFTEDGCLAGGTHLLQQNVVDFTSSDGDGEGRNGIGVASIAGHEHELDAFASLFIRKNSQNSCQNGLSYLFPVIGWFNLNVNLSCMNKWT